jgi:hypothetical protein
MMKLRWAITNVPRFDSVISSFTSCLRILSFNINTAISSFINDASLFIHATS